jgi:hypothetical protein
MKAIIEISGSGGEIVICPLTAGVYEYWFSKGEEDLERYIADGNSGIHPPAADFALDESGNHQSWWELDQLGHFSGAHPSTCVLTIKVNSNGESKRVLGGNLKHSIIRSKSKLRTNAFARGLKDRQPAIQIFSYEKGFFFEGSFEFNSKKDFQDLVFFATSFHNQTLITSVLFKGKELENTGGDSVGMGLFATLCHV